jgi:hypothetical protein
MLGDKNDDNLQYQGPRCLLRPHQAADRNRDTPITQRRKQDMQAQKSYK